jgi:hypothetical protein
MRDATIVLKNTHINDDFDIADWTPNQNNPFMPKGVDATASNSEIVVSIMIEDFVKLINFMMRMSLGIPSLKIW